MKNIQILILLMFSVTLYQCQKKNDDRRETEKHSKEVKKDSDSIVLNISKDISITDISYMSLYKYNEQNNCEQSKAVSIIYNGQLSSCFDYMKTIKGKGMVDFLTLVKEPKTYGKEDVACFDTDYSLIFCNKNNEVVGYINISDSCNKLISNPEIKEREFYSQDGLRKVGFSEKEKEKIKQILGI